MLVKIALATPPIPASIDECLLQIEQLTVEAAGQQATIICFPETYVPGYPGEEFDVEKSSPEKMQSALDKARAIAAKNKVAIILPMDWYSTDGFQNVAFVIGTDGALLGYQTKNQLDPSEDNRWIPGTERKIFEVNGLKFGITICHEGFRYPESTRWAARNDAAIVFHPNCTGSNIKGHQPSVWGDKDSPYYEKATMMRALENTIFFASVNYCFDYPDSSSSLVAPDGRCVAYQPYRKPGVLVAEIDTAEATGLLARRFKSELY